MLRRHHIFTGLVATLCVALPAVGAIGDIAPASLGSRSGVGGTSGAPAISADGRFVAFTSKSALAGIPTLGRAQLFVHDRVLGVTTMASTDLTGTPGNGDVDDDPTTARYAMSADGRYVVFATTATNLTATDANAAARDVVRKDLVTGTVVVVNRGPTGAQTTTEVLGQPDISADGNRVAFVTGKATDLLTTDENGEVSDVVVRDVRAARTSLASRNDAGAPSAGPVSHPAISGDGSTVAFEATATASNLVAGDSNGRGDVIVRDLRTSSTRLASISTDGARLGGARLGDISGDGREVVFETEAAFDGALDGNGARDVYLSRPFAATSAVTLISRRRSDGRAANGASSGATISSDGSRVAFVSVATDLDPGDPNGSVADGYIASSDGVSLRETSRLDGSAPPRPVVATALAGSGAAFAFAYDDGSPSEAFLVGDSNSATDIFVRERSRLDGAGPALDVISPADGVTLSTSRAFVAATVSDPSGVASVTVNGRPALLTTDGGVAARVPIAGEAVLTIAATDTNGNRSERSVRVRRSPETQPAYGLPDALPPPTAEVTALHVSRRGPRRVAVRFSLSDGAVVRARLMRRTTSDAQPAWHPVTPWTRVVRDRGRQQLVMRTPLLARGVYQARVLALATGVRQGVALLVLRGSSSR